MEQRSKNPLVSICIPVYDMPNRDFFLSRCLNSIREQTYQNYEIIVKELGKGMGHNMNESVKDSKGDLIKVLFMDDYFHDKHALKRLVDAHKGHWTVTGCVHTDASVFNDEGRLFNPHVPKWNNNIIKGNNTIGSPSVLLMTNKDLPLWEENLSWMIDCVYYYELYKKFGLPNTFDDLNVVIGIHSGQQTHLLTHEQKEKEYYFTNEIYGKD
jgi:hypothetical protein